MQHDKPVKNLMNFENAVYRHKTSLNDSKNNFMQPQVLELNSNNIHYLSKLVSGIYTSKKQQVVQYNFSYG